MTVAIADIVYCLSCAHEAAAAANNCPGSPYGARCDYCDGPARYRVRGNMNGIRCVGHVQQFLRGPSAAFYQVTDL